ncbi:rhomboid family intramembrane serine protease [Aliamphritea hakodatensis]|uniref:rhomboid family intramembrane serine protease n=1 Tax=Aliamphritea hakodatensis TaxID=2895352 RepID=UPI0022FD9549|nr:rhomboid family intramembrane serine protease [Aliamphritea hakodatensis]
MIKRSAQLKWLAAFIALLWIVEGVNQLTGGGLRIYGLIPRHTELMYGVVTAPFLHGSVEHLLGNTVPLVLLGVLIIQLRPLAFVTCFVILVSGLLVWIFGRMSIHIGASGVVMGYWGFLLSYGVFTRSFKAVAFSLLTILLYGGLVYTLLDFSRQVSFEAHIAGFISGILCAWWLAKFRPLIRRKKRTDKASD